jgi:hypothetical protein
MRNIDIEPSENATSPPPAFRATVAAPTAISTQFWWAVAET